MSIRNGNVNNIKYEKKKNQQTQNEQTYTSDIKLWGRNFKQKFCSLFCLFL